MPVCSQTEGERPSLLGIYVLRGGANSLSIETTAAGSATSITAGGAGPDTAVAFSLTPGNGMTIRMTAGVSSDGSLIVSAPDTTGDIDIQQAILMGIQVARDVLRADPAILKMAVFVRS